MTRHLPYEQKATGGRLRPSERMRDLGIVQDGAPILVEPARPFELPDERETADAVAGRLLAAPRCRPAAHFRRWLWAPFQEPNVRLAFRLRVEQAIRGLCDGGACRNFEDFLAFLVL
ncbi:hypothetical protein ACF1GW_22635 [Streptomyces achromogenes]|uniref:hypothetical protein n=1 Tax=Streptomyces achromogenes TaxID=67255 RepID=UPI0036FB5523